MARRGRRLRRAVRDEWLLRLDPAAVRPGAKTAVVAGLALWLITYLAFAAWVFTGLCSLGVVAASTLGGLGGGRAEALAGCSLYKEA